MKNKKKKGFTLIELIVVIAILGILAAIAVPRLGGFKDSSAVRADKATAATIGKAIEAYYASNGVPATLPAAFVYNGGAATASTIDSMLKDGNGKLPKAQKASETGGFTASLQADGSCIVKYVTSSTVQLYPEQ